MKKVELCFDHKAAYAKSFNASEIYMDRRK